MPITMIGLGHRFNDGPWLFQHLNATIAAGDVVALTGPSGSGKSTLLGIIAGWTKPTMGRVVVDADAKINWVFQNPLGNAHRTAIDHVTLPLLTQGAGIAQAEAKAAQLLAEFNLVHVKQRPFSTLSGGERQRLMLARALACAPDILLVDEPTAQLDQRTAREVSDTLHRLAGRGVAVIIATHDHAVKDACSRHIDLSFDAQRIGQTVPQNMDSDALCD